MWRSEDNLRKLGLSFHSVSSRDRTQAIRYFYQLSYLASPICLDSRTVKGHSDFKMWNIGPGELAQLLKHSLPKCEDQNSDAQNPRKCQMGTATHL